MYVKKCLHTNEMSFRKNPQSYTSPYGNIGNPDGWRLCTTREYGNHTTVSQTRRPVPGAFSHLYRVLSEGPSFPPSGCPSPQGGVEVGDVETKYLK